MGQQTSLMCGGTDNFIGETLVINWLLRDKVKKQGGGLRWKYAPVGEPKAGLLLHSTGGVGVQNQAQDSSRHAVLGNMLSLLGS